MWTLILNQPLNRAQIEVHGDIPEGAWQVRIFLENAQHHINRVDMLLQHVN